MRVKFRKSEKVRIRNIIHSVNLPTALDGIKLDTTVFDASKHLTYWFYINSIPEEGSSGREEGTGERVLLSSTVQ